jgi:hypothetical protein
MIPGQFRICILLLIALALGLGGGCTYSWAPRPVADAPTEVPTKLAEAHAEEDPPRPSAPLAITGPAPAKYSASASQQLGLPALTPSPTGRKGSSETNAQGPSLDFKELPALVPIPSATAAIETKPTSRSTNSANPLRSLHDRASQRYASIESYTAHLRRRERVKGKMQPEEEMFFKFRKQPWSVYFKWVGPEHRGREVVFVQGKHDGKIHTLTAPGDGLFGAGKHWAVSPDSMLVRANSRHAITESGVGVLIDRFGELLDRIERHDPTVGTMTFLGGVRRPEFDAPVEGVLQNIPPGAELGLAQGGQRLWYFDPVLNFPLLTITTDAGGQELEYYCYHRFQVSVRLSDADFNPSTLWKK